MPLQVIGFGVTSEGGQLSTVLKKLDTAFETIDTCQLTYLNVEQGTHICGNVDGAGDCQGDSGGPLFDSNQTQIGIVSYGEGKCILGRDAITCIHRESVQTNIANVCHFSFI